MRRHTLWLLGERCAPVVQVSLGRSSIGAGPSAHSACNTAAAPGCRGWAFLWYRWCSSAPGERDEVHRHCARAVTTGRSGIPVRAHQQENTLMDFQYASWKTVLPNDRLSSVIMYACCTCSTCCPLSWMMVLASWIFLCREKSAVKEPEGLSWSTHLHRPIHPSHTHMHI